MAEQPADYDVKEQLSVEEIYSRIERLEKEMRDAEAALEFEKAAQIRDEIFRLREKLQDMKEQGKKQQKQPTPKSRSKKKRGSL